MRNLSKGKAFTSGVGVLPIDEIGENVWIGPMCHPICSDHILHLCRKIYYHFSHVSLTKENYPILFTSEHIRTIKIDYGLSIWVCNTQFKLNPVKRMQNVLARIIYNNISSHGIDLVRSSKRERRDNLMCDLMLKCFRGHASYYLTNDVTMHVYIHRFDAKSAKIWIYLYHGALKKFIGDFLV